MNRVISKPYNCRPLSELRYLKFQYWTKDELSAFRKFHTDGNIDKFIREWEATCNRINPNRKAMKYDW